MWLSYLTNYASKQPIYFKWTDITKYACRCQICGDLEICPLTKGLRSQLGPSSSIQSVTGTLFSTDLTGLTVSSFICWLSIWNENVETFLKLIQLILESFAKLNIYS